MFLTKRSKTQKLKHFCRGATLCPGGDRSHTFRISPTFRDF